MRVEGPSFGNIVPNEYTFWNAKIRDLEGNPQAIVRVDASVEATIGKYTAGVRLLDQLQYEYGVRIPERAVYGEQGQEDGKTVFYSMVEKVDGLPIVSSKLSDEQIDDMFPQVDQTFASISKYLANIYKYGGAYLNDLKARQFVYGKTEKDEVPHVYLVDIDPYFSIYDPDNPKWSGNTHFLGVYLTTFCNEITYLEVTFEKEMLTTRSAMRELLGQIPNTIPMYNTWIKEHVDHFNKPFSELMGSISNLF
jgi:hypothetical protein